MNQQVQDSKTPAFDMQDLLNRCLGNLEFVERVLAKFLVRFDDDIVEIERALAAKDVDAIARIAHRLKGSSATAGARGIRDRAAEIEELAQGRIISEIPARLEELRKEGVRFTESTSSTSSLGMSFEADR